MNRSARFFQPFLDTLEKKTLLSARPLEHSVGIAPRTVEVANERYYNYIKINTSGFTATDVRWELFGKVKLGGRDELIESGRINSVNGTAALIASTRSSPSSIPGEFRFEYKVGRLTGRGKAMGTSWNRSGPTPYFPTYSLPKPGNLAGFRISA